ncbi:hypothetical protein [Mucilaginibacter ginsenosidivorans]|uniref:DUF4870 domain-containing protein n=1 Tax=Mucilaginibacter ginsenosidivorans TaxID=398053 RepID=A0A5B8V1L6_9SPHI|nr:hypothetical protein [Mucilaginibacter ginsenosidivorans]QEC64551.1 hypothetical protein FRZ54_18895 [Mucilaginibacter ginsenosidivorans]
MEPNNNISTPDDGKTVGIISYLTIVGWLIAYFAMHNEKKTEQGSYQLRQTLLFYIVSIGFFVIWRVVIVALLFTSLTMLALAGTIIWIVDIGFFVLWLLGFIGAVNGQKKPIPLIGDMAQTMFPGI